MGMLQSDKVIFYHPCNDETEYTQTQDWVETTPTYSAGKVSNALAPTVGDSIDSFGAEAEFLSAGAASKIFATALSTTVFVVAYEDGADSNHGTAKVGTVSGTDITFGAEVEFLSANGPNYISIAALTATEFVIVYQDGADLSHGTAKVGTVSGTDITFGAESEFAAAGTATWNSVAALSTTKFVVVYRDNADSNHGTAKVGTVSGTDVTFGAEKEFMSAGADGIGYTSAVALSASKFVAVYSDSVDSGHGTAKVGTVSGTDITFGAESEFLSTGGANYNSAAALSATKFVVAYMDDSDSNHGTAKIGTVSGTDITFGAEAEFLSASGAAFISTAAIGESAFVVVYRDESDANHGTAKVGTVSGTDMTFSMEIEFLSADGAFYNSAVAIGSNVAAVYYDAADSGHGTVRVGTIPSGASLANPSGLGDFGAEKEYLSSAQQPLAGIAGLTATTFVVCYSSTTTGLARVGTVSGTDITFGAESTFEPAGAAAMDPMDAAALSPTKVVVVYMANSPAARNVRAGTVSGTDITWGAATSYFAASTNRNAITALDSAKFVIGYKRDSTASGQTKVGTVSGTDVTLGSPGDWGSSGNINDFFDLVTLDSAKIVVLYHNDLSGGNYSARVGTVSGTDITFATAAVFRSSTGAGSAYIAGDALSSGSFLVAYRDVIDSNHGTAKIGTVTGTAITFGAEAEFSTDNTTNIGVAAISSTLAAVVYRKDTSGDCEAKIATVSGTAIAFGGEAAFLSGADTNVGSRTAALDSSTFVVSYRDTADSNHGTAKVSGYNADPYPTVVSGAKVAFCGWFSKPSSG